MEGHVMLTEIKYYLMEVGSTLWYDIRSGFTSLDNPARTMDLMFYLFIIAIFTGRYSFARIFIIAYIILYLMSIQKQGRWRKRMRDRYKIMGKSESCPKE
jgi:hypothetical protein